MPIEVTMPALSPTMEEGTLAKWLVKEGDTVAAGDIIAEIETDKATMEVEAVDEGTVGRIVVDEGTEGVKVNAVIAVLLEEGEDAGAIGAAGSAAGGDGAGTAEPAAAEKPAAPEPEAQPKSARAAEAKAETPQKGYGRGEVPEKGNGQNREPAEAKAETAPRKDGERIFASPLARRIAKERGVDLAQVNGSGPKGRIVKADIEGFEPAEAAQPAAPEAAPEAQREAAPEGAKQPAGAFTAAAPNAVPGFTTEQVRKIYEGRPFTEVTLDNMRRTIATRLSQAKSTIPHFYLRRDIRLDTLLEVRKSFNDQLAVSGTKLSVNDFVVKACAMALMRVQAANAVWAADRILQLKSADVAVAVAIEGGLLTPVIRDAHAKGLAQISAEMKDLAVRARDRKLQPFEYQGGSFAVSNLGMYGIDNFDAVINPPHASILAVGAGLQKPVVTGGAVEVATVMSVTLSVDHRVIDGALGAQFLEAIKGNLENPMMMLV
jgi:pyruvate dehydrogenase E2 component (dihydrolipoamide acetyltransferase)